MPNNVITFYALHTYMQLTVLSELLNHITVICWQIKVCCKPML